MSDTHFICLDGSSDHVEPGDAPRRSPCGPTTCFVGRFLAVVGIGSAMGMAVMRVLPIARPMYGGQALSALAGVTKDECGTGYSSQGRGYWTNIGTQSNPFGPIKHQTTLAQCKAECDQISSCSAYMYMLQTRSCVIYHDTAGWLPSLDVMSCNKAKTIKLTVNPSFCLNLHRMNVANGGTTNLWTCNGHDSQKWTIQDGTIKLTANLDFCLNLHKMNVANGGTVNLWTCNGNDSQKWTIQDGNIKLTANPDFCLNLQGMNVANGGTINLWKCYGHDSQKWIEP